MTADQVLGSPFVQLGSCMAQVCDGITALSERHGVSYITVFDGRADGFDSVVTQLANH